MTVLDYIADSMLFFQCQPPSANAMGWAQHKHSPGEKQTQVIAAL
jgi:hypothetical protein